MARDTCPQCKQCRREGQKLFLKGERCLTDKCGVERRSYPPGEHGRGRQKQSEYRVQLREKQKAKRYYGVLEKQFRIYYKKASRQPGHHRREPAAHARVPVRQRARAPRLRRLAPPGAAARSCHGHWTVNGRRVNIPSYQLRDNDVIAIHQKSTAAPGDPRRDRADRSGAGLAPGGPRFAHGQGAAQAGAARDRCAGARAAHRRAVLEVDEASAVRAAAATHGARAASAAAQNPRR